MATAAPRDTHVTITVAVEMVVVASSKNARMARPRERSPELLGALRLVLSVVRELALDLVP